MALPEDLMKKLQDEMEARFAKAPPKEQKEHFVEDARKYTEWLGHLSAMAVRRFSTLEENQAKGHLTEDEVAALEAIRKRLLGIAQNITEGCKKE